MCNEVINQNRGRKCKGLGGFDMFFPFNFVENPFTVVDGVATALDGLTGETVYKYELAGDSNIFNPQIVGDEISGTGFCTQNLALQLHSTDSDTSNQINKMAKGRVSGVLRDRNGKYHVVAGDNGFKTFTAESTTGGASGDFNGYNVTATAETKDLPAILDAATVTAFLGLVYVAP